MSELSSTADINKSTFDHTIIFTADDPTKMTRRHTPCNSTAQTDHDFVICGLDSSSKNSACEVSEQQTADARIVDSSAVPSECFETAETAPAGTSKFLIAAFETLAASFSDYHQQNGKPTKALKENCQKLQQEIRLLTPDATTTTSQHQTYADMPLATDLYQECQQDAASSSNMSKPPAAFQSTSLYALGGTNRKGNGEQKMHTAVANAEIPVSVATTGNTWPSADNSCANGFYHCILNPNVPNQTPLPLGAAYCNANSRIDTEGKPGAPYVCIPPVIHVVHSWAHLNNKNSVAGIPNDDVTFPREAKHQASANVGTSDTPDSSSQKLILDIPNDIFSLKPPSIPFNRDFTHRNKAIARKYWKLKQKSGLMPSELLLHTIMKDPRLTCLVEDLPDKMRRTGIPTLQTLEESEVVESSDEESEEMTAKNDKDDADKMMVNLLISWYFAGFYTGKKSGIEQGMGLRMEEKDKSDSTKNTTAKQ